MAEDKENKERTIFILYIPGGAVLGMIPAMVLTRLEELTETPAIHLFQATDGVSTGGLITGSMNIRHPENPTMPKFTSQDIFEKFRELGPVFFPEIPMRDYKMATANIANVIEDVSDPKKADALILQEIRDEIAAIVEKLPDDAKQDLDKISKLSTKTWFSASDKKKAIKLCDTLRQEHPHLAKNTGDLSELIFIRQTNGILSSLFKRSSLSAMGVVKTWARDFLFSAKTMEDAYKELYGEARMSDSLRTSYITTYDTNNTRAQTFYCLKSDFFDLNNGTCEEVSQNDHKIWDSVMASTANPFAFQPHTTEDGMVCIDKAIVHTPLRCVLDVLACKPDNTNVKLVVLGTGRYITSQKSNASLCEEYARYGVLGNLLRGQETAELQNFVMSQAKEILERSLGKDNIIELSPRLSPRRYKELDELPEHSPLDASAQNIEKIIKRTKAFLWEEDQRIRGLAMMMVDNLHNIGQMDDEKYLRVKAKIHASCDPEACKDLPCITPTPDPVKPKPGSSGPTEKLSGKKGEPVESIKPVANAFFSRFFGESAVEEQDKTQENPPQGSKKKSGGRPPAPH